METYAVSDCVFGGAIRSTEYPQGTFQLNDRVYYGLNGFDRFGYILPSDTETSGEAEINATGVNSDVCFDNEIVFNSYNDYYNNNFILSIEIEPQNADFISENSEYPFQYYYYNSAIVVYVDQDDNQDELEVIFSDSNTINNYNYNQGANEIVSESYSFNPNSIVNYYDDFLEFSIYIENAINCTANDCDFWYFLRNSGSQSGTTLNANYRNDAC